MSAELLREAAALMRERAQSVTPGPWYANLGGYVELNPFGEGDEFDGIADTWNRNDGANAEHIASWHPAVALAVAAWLDRVAEALEREARMGLTVEHGSPGAAAETVARAYLGRDA